jgi:hypothetical protein
MAVGIQGDGYACAPQHLRDNLGVDVLGEQQRGARVPEIVKAYLGQPHPLDQGLEAVRGDEAPIQRLPYLRGEDEAVLPPQGARPVYLPNGF